MRKTCRVTVKRTGVLELTHWLVEIEADDLTFTIETRQMPDVGIGLLENVNALRRKHRVHGRHRLKIYVDSQGNEAMTTELSNF